MKIVPGIVVEVTVITSFIHITPTWTHFPCAPFILDVHPPSFAYTAWIKISRMLPVKETCPVEIYRTTVMKVVPSSVSQRESSMNNVCYYRVSLLFVNNFSPFQTTSGSGEANTTSGSSTQTGSSVKSFPLLNVITRPKNILAPAEAMLHRKELGQYLP